MLQKYCATLLSYIGVGFIGGALTHGFFTETRSAIMAIVGAICYLIGQYLLNPGTKRLGAFLTGALLFSISVGMVSGGLQHFLDSPLRSMWIVPVGFFVSLIVYAWQHPESHDKKGLVQRMYMPIVSGLLGAVVAATIMFGLRMTVPSNRYSMLAGDAADHHRSPGVFSTLRREMLSVPANRSKQTMSHMAITSERQFITEMIPHHQEAVDTTTALLRITQNPTLQKLGEQIIAAQTQEITMMQSWLSGTTLSGAATIPTYTKMMRDTSMLSATSTIERMWTEDMIQHHQGAIQMAQAVLVLRPSAKVAEFANRIIRAQTAEITQMQEILGGDTAAVSGHDMMMSGHMMHH